MSKCLILDIVCKNSVVSEIQEKAFLAATRSSGSNPLASCTNAYNLDIDALFGINSVIVTTNI